jgi:hypothetical protein
MPVVNGPVTPRGAVVDILVGVSRARKETLERAGLAAPERVRVRAELDTGSGLTVLSEHLPLALGLGVIGKVQALTTSGGETPHEYDQYLVSLVLEGPGNRLQFHTVFVAASRFPRGDEVQAVLGRDILDECVLIYNGPARTFTLTF